MGPWVYGATAGLLRVASYRIYLARLNDVRKITWDLKIRILAFVFLFHFCLYVCLVLASATRFFNFAIGFSLLSWLKSNT